MAIFFNFRNQERVELVKIQEFTLVIVSWNSVKNRWFAMFNDFGHPTEHLIPVLPVFKFTWLIDFNDELDKVWLNT